MFEVEPDDVYESDGSEEREAAAGHVHHGASFPGAAPLRRVEPEDVGWLLMVQRKQPPPGVTEQAAATEAVFLVHPGTGSRIDLPAFVGSGSGSSSSSSFIQGSLYVFYVSSSSHGAAPLVVARIATESFVPTAHVACPGDLYWSVYAHRGGNGGGVDPLPRQPGGTSVPTRWRCRLVKPAASIADVALLGTQAVCLETGGGILVFDVAEMAWRRRTRTTPAVARPAPDCGTSSGQHDDDDRCYLVASEPDGGELLLVSRPPRTNAFRFFKLDMEALEWSSPPMEPRELEGTAWFLCHGGQSFRAKEAVKRRVYTFTGPNERTVATSLKAVTNVYA